MTTMQWRYGMNGFSAKQMNGIRPKQMNGIRTKTMDLIQLRQPSPTRLPKSNIRSDYIPPRAAENAGIKIIGSSQGQ